MSGSDDPLLPLAYAHLRRLAQRMVSEERALTLQATELVHEAWLRLDAQERPQWQDEKHFCAIAALAMRRILVDRARKRRAAKRGGGLERVTLSGLPGRRDVDLLELDEVLTELEQRAPRQAQITLLKVFGGLGAAEIAERLEVSVRTVEGDWRATKAWMATRLQP